MDVEALGERGVLLLGAANGYVGYSSGYRTPQQQTRPAARQPTEDEFILTVKDVTSSSEGSFAGHIVAGPPFLLGDVAVSLLTHVGHDPPDVWLHPPRQ